MRRWRAAAVRLGTLLACATLLPFTGTSARASGPTITGAGSTWVQPALDQWRADIQRQGYTVNYQGVGSSAGRNFYIINQVDFAASEIPFQPDEIPELQGEGKSYQYLPDVAGATTLMYNLHTPAGAQITNLKLDAEAAAKLFTGAITSWHDPAIQALNPGLQVKEDTAIPVTRSDGSGTSAQFSLFLADRAPDAWNAFVSNYGCPAPCSQWPQFPGTIQANGSDSVANFVANGAIGSGAIGYVEAAFAYGRGFPVAALKNGGGFFVQLTLATTAADVALALTHATLHADLTQDLTAVYRAVEPNAYPMSSYSYMITQTSGFDPAKGAVLGTWLIYIACAGQQEAAPLGYSPLPPNLVQDVFDGVTRIPGAPAPPPLDRVHCPNPTVTTAGTTGGGTTSGSTTTAGGGTTTAGGGTTSGGGATTAGATPGGSIGSGAAATAGGRTPGAGGSATAAGGRTPATSGGGQASNGTSQPGSGPAGGGAVALAPGADSSGVGLSGVGSPGRAGATGAGAANGLGAGCTLVRLPSGATVQTLCDDQRQTLVAQATQAVGNQPAPQTWSLFVAGALIAVVVLGPMLPIRRPRTGA